MNHKATKIQEYLMSDKVINDYIIPGKNYKDIRRNS
jgi:hypothetical protein